MLSVGQKRRKGSVTSVTQPAATLDERFSWECTGYANNRDFW